MDFFHGDLRTFNNGDLMGIHGDFVGLLWTYSLYSLEFMVKFMVVNGNIRDFNGDIS